MGGGAVRLAAASQRSETTAPAVVFGDISVSFPFSDGGSYTAVERASLAVADGEFVSIVGPTGCGKSTLLNVAAGLIAPSQGRVDVFAARLAGLNRDAGYLFQSDALFPWKTALENVAIGLETAGTPKATARQRAQTWLARVGLANFAGRYPHMLSGGAPNAAGRGPGPRGARPLQADRHVHVVERVPRVHRRRRSRHRHRAYPALRRE